MGKRSFMFKEKELQQLASQLLQKGYRIFCSPDPYWQTYFLYSDGTRVAYAQYDRLVGLSFATVHKPNPTSGTGFKIDCVNAMISAEEALHGCPDWARSMWSSVNRYRDLDEFLARYRPGYFVEVFADNLKLVSVNS
jgi:hypothetical protein